MYSPTDINTSLSVKIASWLCGITRVNPNISHASVSVSIHVYQSSDNIRNRKNSMKMQHSASILCILWVCSLCFKNKNTTVKLLSLYFQILNEGIWGEKKDEKAYAAAGFIQFNFYCPPSYFIFTIFSSFFFFSFFRYFDNKVFVSLANGEVIVYQREAGKRKNGLKQTVLPSQFLLNIQCLESSVLQCVRSPK